MTDKEKARELALAYFGETNEQGNRVYDARCEAACQEMATWAHEQFEKNRLAACNRQTKVEADVEMDFVMSIIEKEHRQPTFNDAIKYGKKKIIGKACEWLLNNVRYYSINALGAEYMCNDFRKAMEE